jgi:alginate O-acetyltransferase complex protein AlgJ
MNRALVLLFIIVISIPLAFTLAGVDGADPANENREMAPFPQRPATWQSAKDYPDAFVHWFEDHFGLRARLVRWFGESRLFGLGVSPSSTVIKGLDGWLFYGDDNGLDDFISRQPLTTGETEAWRESLVRAENWLHRRAVAYVFTIAPDKPVIYPEHMPPTIRRTGSVSRTDQVYAALAGTPVVAIDTRQALLEAKPRERLYYMTDTHWNQRGALVAYQAIIEAVRRQVPSVPPAWTRDDFDPIERDIRGKDLAGMLGLKDVLHETDLALVPRRPRRALVVDPAGTEPNPPGVEFNYDLGRVVTEIADPRLPRAVVFRDSFATGLIPYLSEHFSRTVYLWQNDFDADVVLKEHPDVVIQEIVGRHLYSFIASPELVPR